MRTIFKSTAETMAYNFVVALTVFISSVFVARTLGPELKGIYSLLVLIPAVLYTLGHFGINLATNFFIANKQENRANVANTSLAISLALGMFFALLGFLIHLLLKNIFLPGVSNIFFIIVLLIIPTQLVFSSLDNTLLGMKQVRLFNQFYFGKVAINTLLVILIYFIWGGNLLLFILALLFSQLLLLPILIKYVKKSVFLSFNFYNRLTARKLFRFGLKNYLNYLTLYLEFKIDILIVYSFLGSLSVGFYSIAVAAAETSTILVSAINTVIFPLIAGTKLANEAKRHKVFSIFFSLVSSVIISALLFLLAPLLVPAVFGDAFTPAVYPLQILAVATIFSNLKRTIMNNFSAEDKSHINNFVNLPSLALNICLNIFLIPRFGITGAAYASLTSYVLSGTAMLIIYLEHQRINLHSKK